MLGLCPINTQGSSLAKISHGSFSLFYLEAEMSNQSSSAQTWAEIWLSVLKNIAFYDPDAPDNNERRNQQSEDDSGLR